MAWWHPWFTFAAVVAVFIGLSLNYASDAMLVGAVVACAIAGIIDTEEAFSGFANTGMLTIAALYVVVAGLRETGGLDILGGRLLRGARTERQVLARMTYSVPCVSAFLNNTPIVAMFIPILGKWCRNNRVAPSKLLIPLSFLSILGGTCTLIGTSTNLVVNGLMVEHCHQDPGLFASLHSMSFFELSYVGVPYAIIGSLYLLLVGHRLLPERRGFLEHLGESRREYLANMQVRAGCRLIQQTVEDAGLRHLPGLFLIEILREGQLIAPVRPDEILNEGDVLTFTGVVSTIVDLEKIPGLAPVPTDTYEPHASRQHNEMLCEAVVSSTSPLTGKTIRDADFRALYNAAVVAVHRGEERLAGRVGDIVLRAGDTLLLQAGPHFVRAHRNDPDFFLVSGVEDSRPVRHNKALLSLGLLAGLVVLMASGLVPIVLAAFLVAGLMVATRCVSFADARQSIDWKTLLTIAAALGLGKALVNAGCVDVFANAVIASVGQWGPLAVLASIFLITAVFTAVVTNNAAAALMFPFAIGFALKMNVDPRPFAMAVAFAASASFITPLGYQTNLMVYGPGGYRMSDFTRVGLPLNVLMFITATLLIPLVWPF